MSVAKERRVELSVLIASLSAESQLLYFWVVSIAPFFKLTNNLPENIAIKFTELLDGLIEMTQLPEDLRSHDPVIRILIVEELKKPPHVRIPSKGRWLFLT